MLALMCLGRCAGTDTAAYQSLRQYVVSTVTARQHWTILLLTLSLHHYSTDQGLLSLTASAIYELKEHKNDVSGQVSWPAHLQSALQLLLINCPIAVVDCATSALVPDWSVIYSMRWSPARLWALLLTADSWNCLPPDALWVNMRTTQRHWWPLQS